MATRFIVLFSCLILGTANGHYTQGASYVPTVGHATSPVLGVVSGSSTGGVALPRSVAAPVRPVILPARSQPVAVHPVRIPARPVAVPARLSAAPLPIVAPHRQCRETARCSQAGSPVYATDGHHCYKFSNSCQLASANCQRRHTLKPINRPECQKLPRHSVPY